MDEITKNRWIDQYLKGQLEGESLQEFEAQLATDEAFRQEVALHQIIVQGFKTLAQEEELQGWLTEAHQQWEESTETPEVSLEDLRPDSGAQTDSHPENPTFPLDTDLEASAPWRADDSEPDLITGFIHVLPSTVDAPDPADSIPAVIHAPTEAHAFHYLFTNHLELYGPFDLDELSIRYDPDRQIYILLLHEKAYPIPACDQITPLQELPPQ